MRSAGRLGLESLFGLGKIVSPWLAAALIGAVFLASGAAAEGERVSWIDALFTATSAVCVTGLSTINVGAHFSTFGEGVVLALIQVGGVGITTLSTLLIVAAGRARLSTYFTMESALSAVRVNPVKLLISVFVVTVVAEALGAALLHHYWGGSQSWWSALFHSVSAFCNAGFSLFPDSLTEYRANVPINAIFCGLIILGGLGFITLYQTGHWLMQRLRRRPARLFLHSRSVWLGSLMLWALGALMFIGLEYNTSMRDLPHSEQALSALFQSVTTRTAGFNTIDFSSMREATLFFTMFLMLIGGAPGGCAGGIKVTTTMVILASVFARIRGRDTVTLLRRTIPPELVQRSFSLLILSLCFLTIIVFGLLLTEESHRVSEVRSDRFMLLAFEAVSAYGTVGLSAGVTPELTVAGKLMIIVCMFVGRLGPLAVALAVFKPLGHPKYEYAQESLAIG